MILPTTGTLCAEFHRANDLKRTISSSQECTNYRGRLRTQTAVDRAFKVEISNADVLWPSTTATATLASVMRPSLSQRRRLPYQPYQHSLFGWQFHHEYAQLVTTCPNSKSANKWKLCTCTSLSDGKNRYTLLNDNDNDCGDGRETPK